MVECVVRVLSLVYTWHVFSSSWPGDSAGSANSDIFGVTGCSTFDGGFDLGFVDGDSLAFTALLHLCDSTPVDTSFSLLLHDLANIFRVCVLELSHMPAIGQRISLLTGPSQG